MDVAGDVAGDTRWLTYKELGAALGIDEESARRRAQRRKWPRREGNDGRTRVAVPADLVARGPETDAPDVAPDDPGDDAPDAARVVAPDAATLAELAAVRALAEERLRRIEDLDRRLGEERQATAVAREHAARLEGEAAARREALDRAEAERARLREELEAWQAGGPVARAVRAFLHRRARER